MEQNNLPIRIVDLREKAGMTQTELAKKMDFDKSTMSKVENGTRKVSSDELRKLSKIFNVSADYLLGNAKKEHYYDLTEKEKNDIGVQAEKLMQGIESGHDLNFYGEPATEEQKSRLLIAVQTAMEMNKKEAKKKFTPKKYRK